MCFVVYLGAVPLATAPLHEPRVGDQAAVGHFLGAPRCYITLHHIDIYIYIYRERERYGFMIVV